MRGRVRAMLTLADGRMLVVSVDDLVVRQSAQGQAGGK